MGIGLIILVVVASVLQVLTSILSLNITWLNAVLWVALFLYGCIYLIIKKKFYVICTYIISFSFLFSVVNFIEMSNSQGGDIEEVPTNEEATEDNEDYSGLTIDYVIHAGGAVDDKVYLNCQEAFINWIGKGYTYVELDFRLTQDGVVFCSHNMEGFTDFNLDNRPTYAELLNVKLAGKYTPITLDWLFQKLDEYPDVKIVFDTKDPEFEVLEKLVDEAEAVGFNIKERFIIQVYSIENYEDAVTCGFEEYWYTNYKSLYNEDTLRYFEDKDNVTTMVLDYSTWETFKNAWFVDSKQVAIHTINYKELWEALRRQRVDFVFIDYDY